GDGTVVDVSATRGTFVQAGTPLATVERAATRFVRAEYLLTPEELARLDDGAEVTITLPDESTLPGRVDGAVVRTAQGKAEVVVTVTSPTLVGSTAPLTSTGTPVVTALHLRNDGVVTTVAERIEAFWAGVTG